jgi:hypothetical protein
MSTARSKYLSVESSFTDVFILQKETLPQIIAEPYVSGASVGPAPQSETCVMLLVTARNLSYGIATASSGMMIFVQRSMNVDQPGQDFCSQKATYFFIFLKQNRLKSVSAEDLLWVVLYSVSLESPF